MIAFAYQITHGSDSQVKNDYVSARAMNTSQGWRLSERHSGGGLGSVWGHAAVTSQRARYANESREPGGISGGSTDSHVWSRES